MGSRACHTVQMVVICDGYIIKPDQGTSINTVSQSWPALYLLYMDLRISSYLSLSSVINYILIFLIIYDPCCLKAFLFYLNANYLHLASFEFVFQLDDHHIIHLHNVCTIVIHHVVFIWLRCDLLHPCAIGRVPKCRVDGKW